MSDALVALPFGLAIGLVVGAVGGGGAILAFPVLVYVLGEGVGPASTASLIVVALAAAVGAGALAFRGHACWRLALTFAAPAAAAALLGTVASASVSSTVLILAFVPVMLVAAAAMWWRARETETDERGDCPPIPRTRIILAGGGVGLLTGFFGVGGGFLIVPVLTLWLDMSLRRAVASSLVILTLTGLVALAAHFVTTTGVNISLTLALAGSTAVGAFAGTVVGGRLPQDRLGRAFAVVVTAVALFLLVDSVFLGGPPA